VERAGGLIHLQSAENRLKGVSVWAADSINGRRSPHRVFRAEFTANALRLLPHREKPAAGVSYIQRSGHSRQQTRNITTG